jgi:hypothetical protein
LVVGLLIALLALVAPIATPAPAASAAPSTPASSDPLDPPDRPPVTVSDFYPENADLSDCVGFVQRPGCGSEARGGTGQTLAFVALAVGLGLVFWRVAVGVRKNRRS